MTSLEFVILEYYKKKIELTNNDLYKIMVALKKAIQNKDIDFREQGGFEYGDPAKPNIRHISTWLPFYITLQIVANELNACDD